MQRPFSLPPGPVTLDNLTVPGPFVGSTEALVTTSVTIADGTFTDTPADTRVDAGGRMALPAFTDMHTHLDKGHIWPRQPNPDGTFDGALSSVGEDREANWSADDIRARMGFALDCAYAYGTKAIRTHLDSIGKQTDISFGVFEELRDDWKGRIDLQAVCLVGGDHIDPEGEGAYGHVADVTQKAGGVLGYVPYPMPDIEARIENFFRIAKARGMDADLHVDETGDPSVNTLKIIAQKVIETGYDGAVVCGHCCSLAVMAEAEADRTMDLVAQAGLNIVSLPMCNLYLQDRGDGTRTPRWRGVTLVHELKARGVRVSFASDNTRDPFYAYGDLDMVEVMREATRIAHLDHTGDDWVTAFTTTPASVCGFDDAPFAPGSPADLVVVAARTWNEFLSRPQAHRTVIRNGEALDLAPPSYATLDHLMEP
ncbi:MAG: cytosine deaminase [Devosiaceae bacterium]|nr:cytosine deaminase [Devosiaceae bacterium MH13]